MGPIFGWIELIFFYGVALTFIGWQYWSVSRTLEKTRAERIAREEAEAAEKAQADAVEPEPTPESAPSPESASAPPAASDKAA
ncbi:MAG: hypothetical protein AAF127_10345 [Pseudomonadota bacterium]